ncbi:MAG: hypothetical protein E2O85_04815 [Bacteroidetes bacterium]|nr:MAG: hypothetical protein E2O85_04815 [Bacteroidota bacterium]
MYESIRRFSGRDQDGDISLNDLVELDHGFDGSATGHDSESQITVADLAGIAVQDLIIAEVEYQNRLSN